MIWTFILIIWYVVTKFHMVSPILLPNPLDVVIALFDNAGLFLHHTLISLAPLVIGVIIAVVLGVVKATYIHSSERCIKNTEKLIHIFQGLPSFIVMPFLVMWFGHSIMSKAVMVGCWSFFGIYASLLSGYQTLPKPYVLLSHVYPVTNRQRMRHIDLYHALPSFMAGLKIVLLHAPLTVLAAEWFGAHSGLGYLLMCYNSQLNIAMAFAVIAVIAIIILGLNFLWRKLYEKTIFWI
jgi:ABC-type nitrate/sulfonate/bicarbonate transport system permease component